ncbi:hypothetical protein TrRE_jg4688 [Triparma retinervis]|uniref:Uncharacterized protein n=1 Tax=Triparma retinervis TaxID=2557542 RepID=A0A9W7F8M4_9STRA|nr:hypothetical protein TrRE_jg4688 [Triparma retinervis]
MSPTVVDAVSHLRSSAASNSAAGVQEDFEAIGRMIAYGEGLGGAVSFDNLDLRERGVSISGEDTTIYNPGLITMTDQEKDYLISALHSVPATMSLPPPSSAALSQLLFVLDPLRTYELASYLSRLPAVSAGAYLAGVAVMVAKRELFPGAYVGLVAGAFVVPAVVAVLKNGL